MGHRTDKVFLSEEAVSLPVLGQGLCHKPGYELHGVSLPSNCFELKGKWRAGEKGGRQAVRT